MRADAGAGITTNASTRLHRSNPHLRTTTNRLRQFAVAVKFSTLLIAPAVAENGTVKYTVCVTAEP